MKKVLLISYVFPPMAAVGGYRTIKYCKFLPEFGWQPSVLTVRSGYNVAYDHALLDQIDSSVRVYRSGNWEPMSWWDRRSTPADTSAKVSPEPESGEKPKEQAPSILSRTKRFARTWLSYPDRNNFWIPFGVWTGLKAIRSESIDVIYSSSPPVSSHIVAYRLACLTGKPLVLDFRDLWTQNEAYSDRDMTPMQRRIDGWLEPKIINRSSAITTSTNSFVKLLRDKNPGVPPENVHAITNGIDIDDLSHVVMPEKKNVRFEILHLGSLYGHRNPLFFFKAMEAWAEKRPEIIGRVRAEFIGNAPGYEKYVKDKPLNGLITMSAHIPHNQVLNRLWQADLLLLILGFDPGGKGVLPAKLFEYACTGRPILSIVPGDGEAKAVLDEYNNGLTVTEPDIESTAEFLDEQFDLWRTSIEPRESRISIPPAFDRRTKSKELADVLDSILPR